MIEISRSVIRSFRTVLKKIAVVAGVRETPEVFHVRADRAGLRLQARNSHIALEYTLPGSQAVEEFAIPAVALDDFEARQDTPVRFECRPDHILACWQDKAVPQVKQYDTVESGRVPQMPDRPTRLDRQPTTLLAALRDASDTAGTSAARYALTHLQLGGKSGQVVGTDGHQLLVQNGFAFPWDDDVLVPASPVFGCRELQGQEPVSIGRGDGYITLTLGPWTLHLTINRDGRFPAVESLLTESPAAATVLHLDPGDARFLLGNLGALPGAADEHAPVTVEANGRVCVRARGTDRPTPTEVVLLRSQAQGSGARLAMDRTHLARALRLGFARISLTAVGRPVVCRDEKRQYVWQPLDKTVVVSASDDAIRLSSADAPAIEAAAVSASEQVKTQPAPVTPAAASPAGKFSRVTRSTPRSAERLGLAEVLAEAQAVQTLLRQVFTGTSRLVTGLKRYRQQARAVKSSLKALKDLQHLGA